MTIKNSDAILISLAEKLGAVLLSRNLCLTTAESCTGGWLAQTITAIPGSSRWFECGYVTYSNAAKQKLLGVAAATLEAYGAVSAQTAAEMALHALNKSGATVSVAITGIAGPAGGSQEKPVGLVYFGFSILNDSLLTRSQIFSGDRQAIRAQAVAYALEVLLQLLEKSA